MPSCSVEDCWEFGSEPREAVRDVFKQTALWDESPEFSLQDCEYVTHLNTFLKIGNNTAHLVQATVKADVSVQCWCFQPYEIWSFYK